MFVSSSQGSLLAVIVYNTSGFHDTRHEWILWLRLKVLPCSYVIDVSTFQVNLYVLAISAGQHRVFTYQDGQTDIDGIAVKDTRETARYYYPDTTAQNSRWSVFTRRTTTKVMPCHDNVTRLHLLCELRQDFT